MVTRVVRAELWVPAQSCLVCRPCGCRERQILTFERTDDRAFLTFKPYDMRYCEPHKREVEDRAIERRRLQERMREIREDKVKEFMAKLSTLCNEYGFYLTSIESLEVEDAKPGRYKNFGGSWEWMIDKESHDD